MSDLFDGATVDEALTKAAKALEAEVEDLEHEVVEEGTKDFWGLDDSYVRIRAWLKGQRPGVGEEEPAEATKVPEQREGEPTVQPAQPPTGRGGFWGGPAREAEGAEPPAAAEAGPEPEEAEAESGGEVEAAVAEEGPEAPPVRRPELEEELAVQTDAEEIENPISEIETLMALLFADMGFDCVAEVREEEDCYLALISGEDKEYLLESQGRALSALELILNHAFRHRLEDGKKIRVDAGDFRSRREEELRDLAYQVAHSAKQSSSTQETQPLNPYERRLVHLALADDPEVTTRSRGSGFLKNVQVIPTKEGK